MVTCPITEFCSLIRRKRAFAVCLFLCTFVLGLSASAQEAAPTLNPKDVMQHKFPNLSHVSHPPAGMSRDPAGAQQAAAAPDPKEVVLYNFVSPAHGAYPAVGVIRDFEGNLYGTTNGAYSDIGGGGTNNSGVGPQRPHQTLAFPTFCLS
jgi:hypothetical protein